MTTERYPRSPKEQVGGMCHLGRLIDKVRMRHAGLIQDYNYLTVGFDKYLLDKLEIQGADFEERVLQGGTEEEICQWIEAQGKPFSDEEKAQWNDMVLHGGPKNEAQRRAFFDTQVKRGEYFLSLYKPLLTSHKHVYEIGCAGLPFVTL